MFRNAAILAHAANCPCQYCGRDDGTVVAAHSNQQRHGKGMGIKAADVFVAYLCAECHWYVDQSKAPKEMRIAVWTEAHLKSVPLFSHLLSADGWRLLDQGHA